MFAFFQYLQYPLLRIYVKQAGKRMKATVPLSEIVEMFLKADSLAAHVYDKMAASASNAELASLWSKQKNKKIEIVEYWSEIKSFASDEIIPKTFTNVLMISNELEQHHKLVEDFNLNNKDYSNAENNFFFAVKYESFVLRPEVSYFYSYLYTAYQKHEGENEYFNDLVNFLMVMREYAKSPQLQYISEITENLLEQQIHHVASQPIDPLTSILDKRAFFHSIIPLSFLAQRHKLFIAFIIFDIDNISAVNEHRGYHIGNRLIRALAQHVKKNIRKADLVARYGEDKVVAYLSNAAENSLFYICKRLKNSIENELRNIEPVTVSIGGADSFFIVDVFEEMKSLVAKAEDCLSHAKKNGRNRIVLNRKI